MIVRYLLPLLICVSTYATAQQATFRLSDSVFTQGSTYISCSILFDFDGKNEVRSESYPCLDSMADFMKKHPELIIEIGSHTDQRGSDSFNILISQSRARSTKKYLVDHGVPDWALAAVGYGESAPAVSQKTIDAAPGKQKKEELYQLNRRIVFRILYIYSPLLFYTDSAFQVGAAVRLPVLFDLNKASLRPESKPVLDSLAKFLLAHTELTLEVSSHSDSRTSTAYSSCLSCARAQSVTDYLVTRGVPAAQLVPKGYKDTQRLIPDAHISKVQSKEGKEELHALNRRTEVRITAIR